MKLYKKEIQPCKYVPGSQGWSATMEPLEDWQPEENETALRSKYTQAVMEKMDSWASLKFNERYVEVGIFGTWDHSMPIDEAIEALGKTADLMKS